LARFPLAVGGQWSPPPTGWRKATKPRSNKISGNLCDASRSLLPLRPSRTVALHVTANKISRRGGEDSSNPSIAEPPGSFGIEGRYVGARPV
jgi:hypothetical protein